MVEGEEELKLDGMRGEWQEPRHFREVVRERSGPGIHSGPQRRLVMRPCNESSMASKRHGVEATHFATASDFSSPNKTRASRPRAGCAPAGCGDVFK